MPDELQRHQAALARLDRYATLMDARFRVPGTRIRFGLDPIIGLLPGVGDALGLALSLYVVVEAIRLGVSKRVLFRMLRNVALEALVGVVPVLGDVFDIGFKANLRNAALLRSCIEDRLRPTPVRASRRWLQWVLLAVFAALILALLLALLRLFAPVWQGLAGTANFGHHLLQLGAHRVAGDTAGCSNIVQGFSGGQTPGDPRLGGRQVEQRTQQLDRRCLAPGDRGEDQQRA